MLLTLPVLIITCEVLGLQSVCKPARLGQSSHMGAFEKKCGHSSSTWLKMATRPSWIGLSTFTDRGRYETDSWQLEPRTLPKCRPVDYRQFNYGLRFSTASIRGITLLHVLLGVINRISVSLNKFNYVPFLFCCCCFRLATRFRWPAETRRRRRMH